MNLPCYRSYDNGVRFVRNGHRHDCADTECRGCTPCAERWHCTARKNCTWHLGEHELTCGRCIGGVRSDLRSVTDLACLAPVQAINDGVQSEAANLAGPAADPRALTQWQVARKSHLRAYQTAGRITESQHLHALQALAADDDDRHPYAVLTRWQMMIAEDYGHDLPSRLTAGGAAAYLERNLYRVANDPGQDFALLRAELKTVRQHLESVLHNDDKRDRGAPCPTCKVGSHNDKCRNPDCSGCLIVRLERHYAHWCQDETCRRFHFTDDGSDVWRCPRDLDHWWTQQGYADLREARHHA